MNAVASAEADEVSTAVVRPMLTSVAAGTQNRIESVAQLPYFTENIARPDGAVPLREDDARLVALLDTGDRRVVVLWAGEPSQAQVVNVAIARATSAGYTIVGRRAATVDMVAMCADAQRDIGNDRDIETTDATQTFDEWLSAAVRMKASDLHLMLMKDRAVVRIRVNGELIDLKTVRTSVAEAVARAMYSQADVDSRAGKPSFNPREHQGASITRTATTADGRVEQLKLRWESGPIWPDAFDVAIRILNIGADSEYRSLERLGYSAGQRAAMEDALRQPAGVILLCGQTGSGKSTTLATLAEMWTDRFEGARVLRTIEDPCEYIIKGGRQMPVSRTDDADRPEEGFHRALRSAMRMDPDALLLGEIRDPVTADLLQQATLTGHKGFSTVHAASPFAVIWRLEELGIKRERLASEGFINAIVHQELVQLLCENCSVPFAESTASPDHRSQIEADLPAGVLQNARCRGMGCERCTNGISRRKALASILIPDAQIRMLIGKHQDIEAMQHWRSGKIARHGATQAVSVVQQAHQLIAAGVFSPVDADKTLGCLALDTDAHTEQPL